MNKLSTRSLAIVLIAVAAGCARHKGGAAGLTIGTPPAFETRIEVETGSATHVDYFVGDFNGDGKLDMAVASLTGELRILIGNGASFVVGQELDLGGLPLWMSGGDLDNDGDLDLVIVRPEDAMTDVWLNDGAGGFSMGTSLAVGSDALAVAVGDLDDDGNLDVVVSRPVAPEVEIGFGDGAGGFTSTQEIALPGGGSAFTVTVGDANRDGENDLIIADAQQSRVLVYTGTQPANFGQSYCVLEIPGNPAAVTLGDLSGDGFDDLVVTAFGSDRYVVVTDILDPQLQDGEVGDPNVCPYLSFDVLVPARPSLAKVADVTGDGINDLVACLAFTATMCVVPGTPGGMGEPIVLDSSGSPLRPFVGDFDGNGRNDIFALSGLGNRVNLWLARDSGDIAGARSYASGLPGASWVEGADFDGDGDREIITGSTQNSNLTILGSDGKGGMVFEAMVDVGFTINQLEAGDLDLDGRVDIVVSVPGGIRVLRNESTPGNYAFSVLPTALVTLGTSDYPFGITIADFDRDADNDIAICDFAGGGVHIVPGTATPFVFDPEVVIQVGNNPIDLTAADFTGDGLIDIALSRVGSSDIAVLQNNENLNFSEFLTVPVGISPNYLVTEDFNRDGRADLVVSNAVSDTVTVLFATGNGFQGTDYAAGASPTALLAQDLTGDGIVDILVTSLRSGDFRVLVGDGQGSFPLLPSFPGTNGASDAVLQDMTGDGLPDLMVSSLTTNRVSLVRNIRE